MSFKNYLKKFNKNLTVIYNPVNAKEIIQLSKKLNLIFLNQILLILLMLQDLKIKRPYDFVKCI